MKYILSRYPRLAALLLAAVLLTLPAAQAAEAEETDPTAAIYTTSDMFGRLYSQDPFTGADVEASYLKVSSLMAQERAQQSDTLLLDSSNAVSAGLTGDDGQTAALALRSIGYDALVPGVEEFRLGAGNRSAFFQALNDKGDQGTPVTVLSGNYLNGDGSPAATPYQIYTLQLGQIQARIGVLGLGGIDIPQQLPQRLYGEQRFAHSGNQENSYLWEWNYWKPALDQEHCDLIVVVCHGGRDALEELGTQASGIDLLVGGGFEAEEGIFRNAGGETIPYVCSGGTTLTRTTIALDQEGHPVIRSSTLLELAEASNDLTLSALLRGGLEQLQAAGLQSVATLSGEWQDDASLCRQTDTGDLIGEALLWATGADVALVSPDALGVTAASLFERRNTTASLTLGDCARIALDPSPVVTVELTAAQLRQWLEVCASRYSITQDGQPQGGQDADFLYGMGYILYLGSDPGARVGILWYDGYPVADSQRFTVAVAATRLSDPEFPDCTVLWSASADQDYASRGGSTAALLAAYAADAAHGNRTLEPTRSSTWQISGGAYNASLTRLEFVEMLYDLAGRPQPGASSAFIDVADSTAVIWAAETGIVSGDGRGKFLPTDAITREQAAVILYNYARRMGTVSVSAQTVLSQLLDAASVSSWARSAVAFCMDSEILPAAGAREDLYLPTSTITRDDASRFLANLRDYLS